jgi:hypothetical protein
VQDVLHSCRLREFEGCRAIKGLVDVALAEVFEGTRAVAVADPAPAYVDDYSQQSPVDEAPVIAEPTPVDVEVATGGPADDSSDADEPVKPRYSDLWAAAIEATQDENGAAPAEAEAADPAFDMPVEVSSNGHDEHAPEPYEQDGREALRALLAEVTSNVDEAPATDGDEPVDGLKDRGPWTSHELASFERGWADEGSEPAEASPAATAYDSPTQSSDDVADHGQIAAEDMAEEPDEEPAAEEPINRGLLLKFLSSVRN